MDLTFATLMAGAAGDEPDAVYCLAAKSVRISADKLTIVLRCGRSEIPRRLELTAHDAAFSLTALKTKGHPLILQQMRDMVKAEAADDATLVITFAEKRRRATCRFMSSACRFSRRPITRRGR